MKLSEKPNRPETVFWEIQGRYSSPKAQRVRLHLGLSEISKTGQVGQLTLLRVPHDFRSGAR